MVSSSRRRLLRGTLATLALAWGVSAHLPATDLVLLRPDRVIDGRGGVLEGATVVVRGQSIERVVPPDSEVAAGPAPADARVLELSGATLLPGLIDTHVHLDWYFDRNDRLRTEQSGDPVEVQVLHAVENAWRMLQAGVTTVQSLGSPLDRPVRDALKRGVLPGPRILTSLDAITAQTGGPDAIRAWVRRLHADGADVIKIFASASIRDGGSPTLSQEQLDAACGEARRLGLRATVHAHGPESARRAANAGCTTIEHGALLDRETLELLAENGVFYDPNIDLIFRNYFENERRYLGIGNYTAEGFAQMRQAQPRALATFRTALAVPGLQIVFGTDAVAGAHGRNVEELVYRIVEGGQQPHAAILSATSIAASSLGLDDRIGAIAAGLEADLLAVEGNPLEDASALLRPVMVMRAGMLVRSGL
ncbi:MAG TPA: amidohydrolase family protein [Thermoanaerobaculia bacterium]|nr:amidohydrolase family protein [Thermoanaerobaculia bacterium]